MKLWVLACALVACSDKRPAEPDKGSEVGSAKPGVSGAAADGATASGGADGAASGSGSDGAVPTSGSAGSAANGSDSSAGAAASLEAHELFQCAVTSGDQALIARVNAKLGLADAKGAPNDKYQAFVKLHGDWVRSNLTKLKELAPTPAAAKACAEAGLK